MSATVDVETLIDELKFSLGTLTSEEKVLDAITGHLSVLRQTFPSRKASFTPNDIRFLKSLAPVSDQLRSFIELKEELAEVATREDHAAMMSRLLEIKSTLRPFAVGKRVMKELRELNEKLPTIRQQEEGKWQIRTNTRITELEQEAPNCQRNHPMVIREGPHGYFWGCSRYPFCGEAAPLTDEQKGRLLTR
jgi:hypothetical protein